MTKRSQPPKPAVYDPRPRHPSMRADELLASEVAAIVGVQRQAVLMRQIRRPSAMQGRRLPAMTQLSGGGRGVWVFPRSAADDWRAELRARELRRRRKAELRAQGFDVR